GVMPRRLRPCLPGPCGTEMHQQSRNVIADQPLTSLGALIPSRSDVGAPPVGAPGPQVTGEWGKQRGHPAGVPRHRTSAAQNKPNRINMLLINNILQVWEKQTQRCYLYVFQRLGAKLGGFLAKFE